MSFEVILGDLSQMQRTFETEGDHIAGVRHKVNLDPVGTGNGDLDRALALALDKLATLHAHVADVIAEHGAKLRDTHNEYAQTDARSNELFDRLLQISKDQKPDTRRDSDGQ